MRFRLLETSGVDLLSKVEKLVDDKTSLELKKQISLELLTELKMRTCPITYLSQDVTNTDHPIYEFIYELFLNYSNKPHVCQIYKNFQDIKRLKSKQDFDNLIKVAQSLSDLDSNRLKQLEPIITDSEFYKRNVKDFEYSFKVLSTLISPLKIKKYFKDPSVINFEELMDGQHLKPAGIDTMDTSNDTLFGVIRSWTAGRSGKSNSNNSSTTSDDTQMKTDTYTSFEELNELITNPEEGQTIHVDGWFEFDRDYKSDSSNGWKPVEL